MIFSNASITKNCHDINFITANSFFFEIIYILKQIHIGSSNLNQITLETIIWSGINRYARINKYEEKNVYWVRYNKLEGSYKWFRKDGTISSEYVYKNGKKDGLSKQWYRRNKQGVIQLSSERMYENGKLLISKYWYPSGCVWENKPEPKFIYLSYLS